MQKSLIGDAVLVFVTLCWGITFPLIENAVKAVNPAVFVTLRFFVAAVILLPFVCKKKYFQSSEIKVVLRGGLILGILNTISFLSQTIGMETVTAAKGAFITGICVILVPFLLPFFRLGKPNIVDIMSTLCCFLGLFLLTGAKFSQTTAGEFWILLCAVFYAVSIVYLQQITQKLTNFTLLAFLQIFFTAVLTSPFSFSHSFISIFNPVVLIGLLFCSVFATSMALFLQTKFQRYTTASRAAMIFCLEPVFASIFGYLINGEKLGLLALFGAALILLSIITSEFYRLLAKRVPIERTA
ncbi:MAG: hypothetical protein A3E87_00865 [Gammaproteobacteria bacterium RIFCSPHIGHO2_12_FULL_35_23]|nr:MAG: hypothetical protein A3E87_00865 [Gammaproteobacteria bacterium RIFCSPHIGHO2_12_FULL_35_23]